MTNYELIQPLLKARDSLSDALRVVAEMDRSAHFTEFESGYEQAWIEAAMTTIGRAVERLQKGEHGFTSASSRPGAGS